MYHIVVKKETRDDKYGQNIRLTCSCGVTTNWHTEEWKAKKTLDLDIKHKNL